MRAVFLDKDGTLLCDEPYNADPSRMRLSPGAEEALPLLAGAGYALVVVSNQSGVARGLFPRSTLRDVERELRRLVRATGSDLLDVVFCPHHPQGAVPPYGRDCLCRKPMPGMLLSAARRNDISLARSWMVGDILDDVEAGHRAGCATVLVCNGGETEWVGGPGRRPDATAPDLAGAAREVLGLGRARWTG